MKITIAILFMSLSCFAGNKTITRTFTWDSGLQCTVSVDTASIHKYTVHLDEGTHYRYPLKATCTGDTENYLNEVTLYDSDGFEIGSTPYVNEYYGDLTTLLYVYCDNPKRIYDAISMKVSARKHFKVN